MQRQTKRFSQLLMSLYKTRIIGAPNTLEHKLYFEDSAGKIVSPFHDIPLFADASKKIFNMVVEIPRWTNAKMEVGFYDFFNLYLKTYA